MAEVVFPMTLLNEFALGIAPMEIDWKAFMARSLPTTRFRMFFE